MTSLASAEPTVRSFTATVESVDADVVTLDETYFYPEGGGQPADRGTLGGVDVVDVQHSDGHVVHVLADTPPYEPGDQVEGIVDDEFRTYCMRAHTASHLLYGAGRRLLSDLGYGGFDISAEPENPTGDAVEGKVRVDFTTPTDVDDETLVELERLTNQAVWDSYDVSWETVPRADALAREDVAFNTKTEEGIDGETVRIVTIEDWDVAACGGTHVGNTASVGPVTVLGRSNPGKGLTRVEFTVGDPAIRRRARDHANLLRAAAMLDTSVDAVPDAVERLHEERDALQADFDALQTELVEARLGDLRDDVVERNGAQWLVGTLPGLDANALAEQAQSAVGDDADVVALVSDGGRYLAVATAGDVDAGAVVDEVTDEFGGGGGGSQTVAQAGGLDSDPAAITEFLRA